MKIATFNANSIRSRVDAIRRWLRLNRPDVLCVQETKVSDSEFPALTFRELGYHAVYRGEKSYNGVATLSLTPPDAVAYGMDDGKSADATRLIATRHDHVHIVNTYVPQGRAIDHPMYAYKREWFERLRAYFNRHFTPRQWVVWLGDLNVAPEPIDVHNPDRQTQHVCFHEAVRHAFAMVCSWGFIDVVRLHHPEPGLYSFFDYRTAGDVKKNMGWRVDHILTTRPLAQRCTKAWIDLQPRLQPHPSDHTFVIAEFDL